MHDCQYVLSHLLPECNLVVGSWPKNNLQLLFIKTVLSFTLVFYIEFPSGEGMYSQKNWVGVCGPLPKTLTLFMTKICDKPYPIYDLTKNLKPNL